MELKSLEKVNVLFSFRERNWNIFGHFFAKGLCFPLHSDLLSILEFYNIPLALIALTRDLEFPFLLE